MSISGTQMVDSDIRMVDGCALMRANGTLTVGDHTQTVDGNTLMVDNGTLMGHNQHRLDSAIVSRTQ
jgi:hypothetical protein